MSNEIQKLNTAIRQIPEEFFEQYGGGWPNSIATALIDAVYSSQAKYSAMLPRIRNVDKQLDGTLSDLLKWNEADLRALLTNHKAGPGSPKVIYKSEAVLQAAANLHSLGIDTAEDLREFAEEESGLGQLKKAVTKVHGIGAVLFDYFLMNLGIPGVKADTHIVSFVSDAIGRAVHPKEARALLIEAHETWEKHSLIAFDHAIWLTRAKS